MNVQRLFGKIFDFPNTNSHNLCINRLIFYLLSYGNRMDYIEIVQKLLRFCMDCIEIMFNTHSIVVIIFIVVIQCELWFQLNSFK